MQPVSMLTMAMMMEETITTMATIASFPSIWSAAVSSYQYILHFEIFNNSSWLFCVIWPLLTTTSTNFKGENIHDYERGHSKHGNHGNSPWTQIQLSHPPTNVFSITATVTNFGCFLFVIWPPFATATVNVIGDNVHGSESIQSHHGYPGHSPCLSSSVGSPPYNQYLAFN